MWQKLWQSQIAHSLDIDGLAYYPHPLLRQPLRILQLLPQRLEKEEQGSAYVDKVIEELAVEAEQRSGNGKIQAVYFGGGTPTGCARLPGAPHPRLLPIPAAGRRLRIHPRRREPFRARQSPRRRRSRRERISIGIQTFNTAIRRRLGRKHSGEEAYGYLKELCGLDAVIVADLIFRPARPNR